MTERLVALANGRLLGEIRRDARGRLSFEYDAAWSQDDAAYPLSLSMPLTVSDHDHDKIDPWLWGLLPDNENVLARWARRFQVSARSAFSLLGATGGTDAHARNFSLLIGAGGSARLAPLYDLASALPYPGHYAPKLKLAMKIGGESRLGYVQVRHWERFAAEVGLPADEVLEICESLAAEVPDHVADIVRAARSEGLNHPIVDRLKEAVTKQAQACLDSLRR